MVGKARRREVVVSNAKVVGDVNGALLRSRGLLVGMEARWRRGRPAVHADWVLVGNASDGTQVKR